MIFFNIVIFIFGLVMGSFLNCVIYRLKKSESFLNGRSYCPHCRHKLTWPDLIPVLSFFILRGRCRYCQQKISWQYPLVEISTAIIFLLIFNFQFSISNGSLIPQFLILLYYWTISAFLIVVFVYDLEHLIIPDQAVYPAIGLALIFNFQFLIFNQSPVFENAILSSLGAAIFFLLIILASKGKWMGLGDAKLAILMGLLLGFPNILVGLFLAFFIGAIIGLGLIIWGGKTLKSEVSFGPFLVAGTFIASFWGQNIINWYVHLFS